MRVQTKLLIAILLGALAGPDDGHPQAANDPGQTVSRHVQELLPDNNLGGVAVALRVNGKTSFYNYGMADAARQQPITSDSIFNLASVGGNIQEVTLGQIASHTSGLPRDPGQYETWHRGKYTLHDVIRFLNDWQADPQHEPGKQDIYSNLAMILLRLALERRFHEPFATLMKERITGPLGMDSTALQLSPALRARAVQGYGPLGRAIGQPGIGISSNMDFAVAGQIFSSPRDMAAFLTANMGELPGHRELQDAMALAQQGVFTVNPRFTQALAWQIVQRDDLTVIDKNGGLPVTSTYIGFAPAAKVGIVILENRGRQKSTRVGRQILRELARAMTLDPPDEGADPD
jgi:beta-lactamase class C